MERNNEMKQFNKLLMNEEFRKMVYTFGVTFLCVWFGINNSVYAATDPMDKIDELGAKFLSIIQRFGYHICIIMCVIEVIKALINGDTKGAGKIFFRYLIAYIVIMATKTAFDWVKYTFAG